MVSGYLVMFIFDLSSGRYTNDSKYAHCGVDWNPYGNAMNFMDLKVPIISLYNETEVNYIIKVSS